MQVGAVTRVTKSPQHTLFIGTRYVQEPQSLVGMGGEYHLVKILNLSVGHRHANRMGQAFNALHSRVSEHRSTQLSAHAAYVFTGAAHHGTPLRTVAHLQQAVIHTELNKSACGIMTNICRRG